MTPAHAPSQTPAEIVAALHPVRPPASLVGLEAGGLVAAFGLGLLLALAGFALVRPVLRKRPPPQRPGTLLARLGALPPEAQPLAAARVFTALGASLPPALTATLYRPGATLDLRSIRPALDAAWDAADAAARSRAGA